MAATQTSLNDYFKNTRSAREGTKQIKGSLQSEQNISDEDHVENVVQLKTKSIENVEVIEVKLNSLKENVAKNINKKTRSTKKSSKSIKDNDQTKNENILSAFSKQNGRESQTNKRKRAIDDEEEETSDQSSQETTGNSDKEGNKEEHTPQNSQKSLENQRKRRCTTVQDDKCTPNKTQEETTVQRSTRGSARKKLLLGESPCSTEVKNDASAAALRQKLLKCNKLNELRAQLLKVKTCEKDLAKFRAGVEKAQHEKEVAKAVALGLSPSKALPLSPRKAPMSPLKAPSSPRKLYSPHRLAASPYLPPPSPRTKPPHPQLQQFSGLDVEVPLSPCKTPTKTPPASPISRAPAYQRYSHLLQDRNTVSTDEQSELSLPYKYRVLRELFRSVDTVVSMLHNRHEAITFSRLRTSVQQMVRRTFSESNLGQLKAMFPLAYFYKQEKVRPGASSSANHNGSSTSGYELTISANLNYKDTSSESSKSTRTGAKVNLMDRLEEQKSCVKAENVSVKTENVIVKEEKQAPVTFRKMDSLVLVERRSIFHASLLKAIHKHHLDFLKTLDPPVSVSDPNSIKRWHPSFDLDSVPDVQPDELPAPPSVQSYSDANSVLATARNLFSLNSRLKEAVENVVTKKENETETVKQTDQPKATPPQNKNVALALKGISASLLERIRAREAAQANKVMLRTPSQTKRLTQLSALPQMARILRHTFIADKKAALPIEAVIKVLRESHTGMLTQGELFDHLDLLIEEVPQFVSKHKLSSGIFIKVDKKTDINVIVQQIDKKIKLES